LGLWENLTNYLFTGVGAQSIRAGELQQYSSWETMSPSWALTDTSTFVKEGHRKNALAYGCTEWLAREVGLAVLEAIRITSSGETVLPERDPLAVLIQRPSSRYPSQATFFRQVVRLLYVTGEAIYYKVPGEQTGRVVELQNLPSDKVAVKKNASGEKYYEYHYDPAREPKILKEDEVIFLKFDDVGSGDRGLAPLAAAAREVDVDNAAADIRKTFFEHSTMLSGLLTTEQQANEKQLKEWSAMWSARFGGPKNAGKTPALAGGLDYKETSSTPDKWAFPDVTGLSEARICSAFGLPPILVGAKIGLDRATYANYKEARSAAWEDTVVPLLNFLAESLAFALTEPGDRRSLRWNVDDVPALQEDADDREERSGRILRNGSMTINEYREAAGLDPVDDGDMYMLPQNVTLVPAGELNVDRTPEALEEGEEEEEDAEEDSAEDQEGQEEEGRSLSPRSNGDTQNGHHEHSQAGQIALATLELPAHRRAFGLDTFQRSLSRAIESVLGKQVDGIVEKLSTTLDPQNLIDLGVEAQRMAEGVLSHIRNILMASGDEAAKEVDEDNEFDAEDEEVLDYLDSAPLLLGDEMARTTRDLTGQVIEEVQAEDPDGWTTDAIAKRLREIVASRDRANLAAETETVRTANRAARLAYRQSGIESMTWRTTSAEPCEFCRSLDGKTVGVDEAFAELGEEIEGEDGGTMAVRYETLTNPPTHPRCGCYIEHERT
jgi:HK97 family phage portal protein